MRTDKFAADDAGAGLDMLTYARLGHRTAAAPLVHKLLGVAVMHHCFNWPPRSRAIITIDPTLIDVFADCLPQILEIQADWDRREK